jgi:hypothetical protein
VHHDGLTPLTDDTHMKLRALRILVVAVTVLALALPALAAADRGTVVTDSGVVQSVSPTALNLRELDGTVVSLAVGPATRVRVNGKPARLEDVRPGFVATVLHIGAQPAVAVRAFGKIPVLVDRGVVTSLSPGTIALRREDGTTVTVPLDGATKFRRLGVAARRAAARPGAVVAVTHPDGGTARVVNVLRRA